MNQLVTRAAVFVLGLVISCTAYCVTVRANIGLGPLFLVQAALEQQLGLSAGTAATLIGLLLVALSALVQGGVGIGTVVAPVLGGVIIDFALPLIPTVQGRALQVASCSLATATMMLGGALIAQAGFGVGGMDGVMRGLSCRSGLQLGHVRIGMEAALLLLGLWLGSTAGIGTLITALLVGHCYQFWLHLLSKQTVWQVVRLGTPSEVATQTQSKQTTGP